MGFWEGPDPRQAMTEIASRHVSLQLEKKAEDKIREIVREEIAARNINMEFMYRRASAENQLRNAVDDAIKERDDARKERNLYAEAMEANAKNVGTLMDILKMSVDQWEQKP